MLVHCVLFNDYESSRILAVFSHSDSAQRFVENYKPEGPHDAVWIETHRVQP